MKDLVLTVSYLVIAGGGGGGGTPWYGGGGGAGGYLYILEFSDNFWWR